MAQLIEDIWNIVIDILESASINYLISLRSVNKYCYQLVTNKYPNRIWLWSALDLIYYGEYNLFFESFCYYYPSGNRKDYVSYLLGRLDNRDQFISRLLEDNKISVLDVYCGAIASGNITRIDHIVKSIPIQLCEDEKRLITSIAISTYDINIMHYLHDIGIIPLQIDEYSLRGHLNPYENSINKRYQLVKSTDDEIVEFLKKFICLYPSTKLSSILYEFAHKGKIKAISYILDTNPNIVLTCHNIYDIIDIGNVELVRKLKIQERQPDSLSKLTTHMSSSIEMLEYFKTIGIHPDINSYYHPIANNRLEIIEYLFKNKVKIDNSIIITCICRSKSVKTLQYLLSLGLSIPSNIYDLLHASILYSSQICYHIKYLYSLGIKPKSENFCSILNIWEEEFALDLMKFLIKEECYPPEDICENQYPEGKHLVLRYLVSKGYSLYHGNLIQAIEFNNFYYSKYVLKYISPTRDHVALAIMKGQDICKLILDSYPEPIDSTIYNDIKVIHNLSGLIELDNRGIPPPKHILDLVHFDNLPTIKYLVSKHYPISKKVTDQAIVNINYSEESKDYLSYLWFHTKYEFDKETTYKLELLFGNRLPTGN